MGTKSWIALVDYSPSANSVMRGLAVLNTCYFIRELAKLFLTNSCFAKSSDIVMDTVTLTSIHTIVT
jgi:hypothetical protein